MATLIKEVKMIKTEVESNNNKWWTGQLFDDGTVKAFWGRVGYKGDDDTWDGGDAYLQKKFREKIKKGYTELKTISNITSSFGSGDNNNTVKDRDLQTIARTQLIKSSNPILEKLIKRFVDANVHKITSNTQITYNSTTGLFATPLGIVSLAGLTEARNLLAELAPLVRNKNFGSNSDALLSKYLRLIPQHLGMGRFSTQSVIPDDNAIQKQMNLLDSLESSYQATQTAAPVVPGTLIKPQEQVFKVDLDVLTDQSERTRLDRYFETSKKRMHGYDNIRIQEVFKITIHDMDREFEKNTLPIKEVFHGTNIANTLSILKCGLKISPPATAVIAGKMMGNGLYGAINSSKSMGYTFGRWTGSSSGECGYLFICSFAMGKIYETQCSCSKPHGYDSVWAKAGSNLHNDELVVYRNSQANIKYLLEIK